MLETIHPQNTCYSGWNIVSFLYLSQPLYNMLETIHPQKYMLFRLRYVFMMYKDAKDRDNVHTHARMHARCRGRRRVGRREATRRVLSPDNYLKQLIVYFINAIE